MRYVDIFRDHPIDDAAPWLVPASFSDALSAARRYSPTFGLPTCSGARCECGAEQDEFDIIESSEGLRFICEDCND
jgi:hypothetical protein